MRRAPCPRCARPGGVPIVYGLPDGELFEQSDRGLVHLGGCAVSPGSPEFHCTFCGREWTDGPLPSWWPPEDVERMDPWDRLLAHDELTGHLDDARVVVDTLEIRGLDAAAEAAVAIRPSGTGSAVPSDCVLLAETLDAALALCRALASGDELVLFDDGRLAAVDAAHQAFRRAEAELRDRGDVDVLRDDEVEEDDEDDEDEDDDPWMTDEDRFARAARTGDGSELPDVGPEWHERLDAVAGQVLGDGSATAWARWLWPQLRLEPITTEADLARAGIRLVVLAELRRAFLERLDGDAPDEFPLSRVDNPGIEPYYVGYLAAADGVDPGYEADGYEDPAETEAFRELVRVECDHLSAVVAHGVGGSQVFAHTWASRFTGARYPLSSEAMDEALNNGLSAEKHIASEWVDGGMRL